MVGLYQFVVFFSSASKLKLYFIRAKFSQRENRNLANKKPRVSNRNLLYGSHI